MWMGDPVPIKLPTREDLGSTATGKKAFPDKSPQRTQAYKYDVFLSHDWGEGGLNHKRVAKVSSGLKRLGFRVWLDEEELPAGDMSRNLHGAIDDSMIFVVFVTRNYQAKLIADDNHCADEFTYAMSKKGRGLVLTVVMEAAMLSVSGWEGPLEYKLRNSKFVPFHDDTAFEASLTVLAEDIKACQGKYLPPPPQLSVQAPFGSLEADTEQMCSQLRSCDTVAGEAVKTQLLAVVEQPSHSITCRHLHLAIEGLRLLVTRHKGAIALGFKVRLSLDRLVVLNGKEADTVMDAVVTMAAGSDAQITKLVEEFAVLFRNVLAAPEGSCFWHGRYGSYSMLQRYWFCNASSADKLLWKASLLLTHVPRLMMSSFSYQAAATEHGRKPCSSMI
jgi:hypothetical protein